MPVYPASVTAHCGHTRRMDLRRLGFAVLPVAAAAGLGGLGSRDAPKVYQDLHKPGWAPPASAFAPVWSTLYVLLAAAGWRLEKTASTPSKALHLTQLGLNAAWPATFFGFRNKRASLAVITLLDLVLLLEVDRLLKEDRPAAVLLLPYLAWCGFATALNVTVSKPQRPTAD